MTNSIRQQKKRRFFSRLVGLILIVTFCAMAVPLPMSLPSNPTPDEDEKDQSEPFPCQNRPCGCRTADQCWKKCCCFTNAQKVAWAKANRVKVPDFVAHAAAIEIASTATNHAEICSLPEPDAVEKERLGENACCRKTETTTTAPQVASIEPSQSYSRDDRGSESVGTLRGQLRQTDKKTPATTSCSCTDTDEAGTSDKQNRKLVSGLNQAECQGLAMVLVLLSTSLDQTEVSVCSSLTTPDELLQCHSERLPLRSLRPPLPRPKIG